MTIMMPASDQAVLARRDDIVAALRAIVPGEGVIDSAAEMLPYESDGLMAYRQPPMVVVLPDTTEQVSQVLKYCFEQGIKVVPRGSGTSLSGGALPLADGVLLGLGKFKRIREIDFDNRAVVTEPGVTNLAISEAVAHGGFYYAPDPSSQIACSIGGNVAENSGGVHCLKYGISMPPGMMPAPMIRATHSPAASTCAKPTIRARAVSGFCRIRTVTSVMTPSRPSDPVMMPIRS